MARIISWSFILLTMYNAILQPEPEPVRKDQKPYACASFAISRSNMEATSKMLLLLFMVAFEVFAGKCFIILLCVTSNLCRHSTARNCVDYRSCSEVRSSSKRWKVMILYAYDFVEYFFGYSSMLLNFHLWYGSKCCKECGHFYLCGNWGPCSLLTFAPLRIDMKDASC